MKNVLLIKIKLFHNLGLATNICKIVTNFFVTLCPPHLHLISNCVLRYFFSFFFFLVSDSFFCFVCFKCSFVDQEYPKTQFFWKTKKNHPKCNQLKNVLNMPKLAIGEGPASQPQSTLSCWKKFPTVNNKFWPPLNLV